MRAGMRTVLSLAVFLCLPAVAPGATLDWGGLVALAKVHNQDLRNAELSIEQAEIEHSRAVAGLYPQLSSSAGYSVSGDEGGRGDDSYSLGVSGSLPLFSGFKNVTEVQIQKANREAEHENYRRTLSDVIYRLKSSYIELLAAQEMLALWRDINRQRTDNYNLVRLKYQAGREDRGSLLRMEADKLQAEYELSNARRDSASAMLELMKNVGLGPSDTLAVAGSLEADSLEPVPAGDSALARVPEYRLARLRLVTAGLKLRQSKSGYYPGLSLSSGYSWRGSSFPPNEGGWNAGLSLSYPLTGALNNRYQAGSARNSLEMAENDFGKAALSLNAAAQSARNDLLRAMENIAINQKYLAASAEQSKITTRKYMNGLATYTEWYSVEGDYINAKKNMLSSRKNSILLRARLANIMGEGE